MAPRNDRVVPTTASRSPARSFLQAVDTFYAPARDRRGEAAIQQGVDAINGILNERALEHRATQRDAQFQEGVADAIREQAGEELQGVQTGTLFRQNSRFYMMGLNETRGRSAAADFRMNMANAYREWEGRDQDDDGSLFREWMNGQLATFTDGLGGNQYMLAGALPTAQQVANNMAQQHAAYTQRRLAAAARAAYRNIHADIWNQVGDGEGQISVDEALAASLGTADDQYNFEGGEANGEMIGAVIDYANIANDTAPLEALIEGANNGTISIGLGHRADLAEALDRTRIDIDQAAARENRQVEAERQATAEAQMNNWATNLQADPFADMPPFNEIGDHGTYADMVRLQGAFQNATTQAVNPLDALGARMQFEGELAAAQDTSARVQALADYVIANPGAMSVTQVGQYSQEIIARGSAGHVVNNPIVQEASTRFGQTLGAFQTDEYSVEQVSVLRTQGQRHFDEYFIMGAETIDPNNPADILNHIREAETYAMERLSYDFPEIVRDRINRSPAEARTLGAPEALQQRDEAVEAAQVEAEAEAAEFFSQFTEGEAQEEAVTGEEAPAGSGSTPEEAAEATNPGNVTQAEVTQYYLELPFRERVEFNELPFERQLEIVAEALGR